MNPAQAELLMAKWMDIAIRTVLRRHCCSVSHPRPIAEIIPLAVE
jgi:hypothetical protein